jgi:hypothetical protein
VEYTTSIATSQFITNKTYPLDATDCFKIKFKEMADKYEVINGIVYKTTINKEEEDLLEVLHKEI